MNIREISQELLHMAKSELGEDPARLSKDLQSIKDWIAKQRHLTVRTDDQWLIAFLRGCKFSLERTKEKLDTFYSVRTALPEVSSVKNPMSPIQQAFLSCGVYIPLQKTAKPDGPRVMLLRPGQYDPNHASIMDALVTVQMSYDIMMLEDDNTVISGIIFIVDLSNVTITHLSQMTPANVKKLVSAGQDCMPIRQKGSHYIHTPPGFETVFNLVKMFMNEKNRSRTFVHNENIDELHKYVPKEILPTEYNGNGGSLKDLVDYWKSKVESYTDWFAEDVKYKSDESLRPGKPKNAQHYFGIDGSFRQLSVD